jgi:hypothetical protein
VLGLGSLYISNFLDAGATTPPPVALELVLCDIGRGGCGLLQLKHTTSPEMLYQQYWYRSGVNVTMREALADITHKAERFIRPKSGDVVLDIGCNDGTLLRSYNTDGLVRVGFEPADNLVPYASEGTDKIVNRYFNFEDFDRVANGTKARIITSIAMFYDLEEPNTFTADIARCLDQNGVWIIQMSYLPLMLEANAFDNICHEHLEYYSLTSLRQLLARHDLQIVDAELNDVNGGSFRVYACHVSRTRPDSAFETARVNALDALEQTIGLASPTVYEQFAARVGRIRSTLHDFVRREAGLGKTIYVYGASTKGNTLLQYCGLDATLIKAAAERNPDKWGRRTVGTAIPIVSEDDARRARPDYFLVLPWHFLKEFMERERAYLAAGGRFLVPLPYPEVVTATGRQRL